MAMRRKSMSRKSPTRARQTASTTKIRLKKVNTFSRIICFSVLVGASTGVFAYPAAARSAAWAEVSP